jgi:hypothetical protein
MVLWQCMQDCACEQRAFKQQLWHLKDGLEDVAVKVEQDCGAPLAARLPRLKEQAD